MFCSTFCNIMSASVEFYFIFTLLILLTSRGVELITQNESKCWKGTGFYPDESGDCSRFYRCKKVEITDHQLCQFSGWLIFRYTCPKGMSFSNDDQYTCKWDNNCQIVEQLPSINFSPPIIENNLNANNESIVNSITAISNQQENNNTTQNYFVNYIF